MVVIDLDKDSVVRLGADDRNDVIFSKLDSNYHFTVSSIENAVEISSNGPYEISGMLKTKIKIAPNETRILSQSPLIAATLYTKAKDSSKKFDLAKFASVTIGRDRQSTIRLNHETVSRAHAKIIRQGREYELHDLESANGTFINNKRVQSKKLNDNDVIYIAGYKLIFSGGILFFKNVGDDLSLIIDTERKKYPYFQKSTRLLYELPFGEVEIQAPPPLGAKPELNIVSMLLPLGASLIPVIIGFFLPSGAAWLTLPMLLAGVLGSIHNYKGQTAAYKQTEQVRLDKYGKYLQEISDELSTKTKRQRDIMNTVHPAAQSCFRIAQGMQRRLWERVPGESDFMSLRLGLGKLPFGVSIRIPQKNVSLEDDGLLTRPGQIAKQFSMVDDLPICVSLVETPTVGIIGDRSTAVQICKNIMVQAATHHSYNELKIITIFQKSEDLEWNWIRWLPHSWDDEKSIRYMAASKADASVLLKEFEEMLKQRARDIQDDEHTHAGMRLPFLLFVVTGKSYVENEPIMRYVMQSNTKMGVGMLMLFDSLGNLPSECKAIVEAQNGKGRIFNRNDAGNAIPFLPEKLSYEELDAFARSLAPTQLKTMTAESELPGCITFLQGYGVMRAEEIDLAKRWQESQNYKTMAVPIGVKSNGDPFYFDIHEKAHGPHGLVAGMTGSGKSEMIQTWILSMSLNFSPNDVSFVLIDFKGTGLILPFMDLPHLAGTISDLDTNIYRNLIALENELSRRKAILDKYGVNNINGYLKLLREGKATEPLPFLFVVIDEFAEFKIQFPDFMMVVNSIFAIGRTLGVFIVLLTQKPSGVVDDKMYANTRFRWCLKVASSADSKEMIRHPDAAKITVPGRGFVQVGEDEIFELVQSYWSGAPYHPNAKTKVSSSVRVSAIDLRGRRHKCDNYDKTVGYRAETSEIDVVVKHIARYVQQNGLPNAKPIWTPKLRENIPLEELLDPAVGFNGEMWQPNERFLVPVIGLVDDPRSQTQYPLGLNIGEVGHVAVYGAPGTGKTTLLQTLVMSLALSYSPEDVNIYIMDFGGWSMGIMGDIPHIGGIANGNEEEKIEKLVRLLSTELEERKRRFAKEGVQNFLAYQQVTDEVLPAIVFVLDNFAPVYNLYPDLEAFFIAFTQQGGSYGMYLVVSTGSIMSLGFRMGQNIKMAIALQMADLADYSAIVGKTDGLFPDRVNGRGLVKGMPPLEFQTALPIGAGSDSERVRKMKEQCTLLSAKWTGKRAKPIPIMPGIIPFGSLAFGGTRIPLGLSTVDTTPVYFDLSENHFCLISGTIGSGKSNLLKSISKRFKELDGAVLAVLDSEEYGLAPLKDIADHYFVDADAFDAHIAALVPMLQERRERYAQDRTTTFSPYAIVVDNIKHCFDTAKEETLTRLEAILRLGKGLNVYVFAAGQHSDIIKLHSQMEKLTVSMVNGATNILLGGKPSSHSIFETTLSYPEKEAIVGNDEGYLLKRGNATRMKTVFSE